MRRAMPLKRQSPKAPMRVLCFPMLKKLKMIRFLIVSLRPNKNLSWILHLKRRKKMPLKKIFLKSKITTPQIPSMTKPSIRKSILLTRKSPKRLNPIRV